MHVFYAKPHMHSAVSGRGNIRSCHVAAMPRTRYRRQALFWNMFHTSPSMQELWRKATMQQGATFRTSPSPTWSLLKRLRKHVRSLASSPFSDVAFIGHLDMRSRHQCHFDGCWPSWPFGRVRILAVAVAHLWGHRAGVWFSVVRLALPPAVVQCWVDRCICSWDFSAFSVKHTPGISGAS